jgi:uncharacterized protein YneF (UPF0154 family)
MDHVMIAIVVFVTFCCGAFVGYFFSEWFFKETLDKYICINKADIPYSYLRDWEVGLSIFRYRFDYHKTKEKHLRLIKAEGDKDERK